MLPTRKRILGRWLPGLVGLPTLMLFLASVATPSSANPFACQVNPEVCSPGWTESWRGPMPAIACPELTGTMPNDFVWIEAEAELLDPASVQPLPPEILHYLIESGQRNASAELSEFTDFVTAETSATPVWRSETRVMEFWIDPGADPSAIVGAAKAAGVAESDIEIRHRAFPVAELEQAKTAVWADGVLGIPVTMMSARYDGSAINVGLASMPDAVAEAGVAATSGEVPIAQIGNIPIYLDPLFGIGQLVPLPRIVPGPLP